MNNLLSLDGPIMQLINKIVYSVYLNILWFICCIPIVTVGASTTALFYVTLKIARNEEGHITKAFFRSFRENLKQGTLIWMILLAFRIILGINGYVVYHMRFENAFWTICAAFLIIAAAAYNAADRSALFYSFCHLRRGLMCTALLLSVIQYFTALPGENKSA